MVIGNIGKYFCQFQFAKYCGKQTFKHCFLYKVSNQCSCQYDQLQYPADHDIFVIFQTASTTSVNNTATANAFAHAAEGIKFRMPLQR